MSTQVAGLDAEVEDDVTRLLAEVRGGSSDAWQRFVGLVYQDLRRMAQHQLGNRRREHTLDTTGLVHECYLRLARSERVPDDRRHFFALAARVMRQVIVDHARERLTHKRGAGRAAISLERVNEAELVHAREFVAVDDALRELERVHERQARVVECRFFAGLTECETAEVVGVSLRLVQRDWSQARAWLARYLRE